MKIWQVRKALAVTTQTVAEWNQATHEALISAPEEIFQGQEKTRQFRDRYRELQPRIRQIRQVFLLLNWLRSLLQRRRRFK